MKLLQVDKLQKKYGDREVLSDVTFSIEEGEIFGFLGPNGAGKTTTIEILCGLKKPSGGHCYYAETTNLLELAHTHPEIGVQMQFSEFYPELTVRETIQFFYSLHKRRDNMDEYVDVMNLRELLNRKIKHLSGGQRQRLSLCATLASDPKLIILDEPTVGLDPQSRHSLWDIILDLKRRGKTLVLTTHYMDEVQNLCDTIAIIDRGTVIASGTLSELLRKLDYNYKIILKAAGDIPLHQLEELEEVHSVTSRGNHGYTLKTTGFSGVMNRIPELFDGGSRLLSMETVQANLEDLFLALTGKEMRD